MRAHCFVSKHGNPYIWCVALVHKYEIPSALIMPAEDRASGARACGLTGASYHMVFLASDLYLLFIL